jgi:hypothetical protein
MATATLSIKQGATLQLLIAATNDNGTPLDLTNIVVSAEVRNFDGLLIDTLGITPTGITGQLSVAQNTTVWPISQLTCDFKFVSGSTVLKSDTFIITVLPAITT